VYPISESWVEQAFLCILHSATVFLSLYRVRKEVVDISRCLSAAPQKSRIRRKKEEETLVSRQASGRS
jgi:hypothetical protein